MNWSIPAFYYLPALAESGDPIPGVGSATSGLFSQTTAVRTALVSVGPARAGDHQNLTLVRSLSLDDLDAIVPPDDFYADLFPAIRDFASDVTPPPPLAFDIYEDSVTGATLGLPAGLALDWNDDLGVAEAIADGGAVRMYVGVLRRPPRAYMTRASRAAEGKDSRRRAPSSGGLRSAPIGSAGTGASHPIRGSDRAASTASGTHCRPRA